MMVVLVVLEVEAAMAIQEMSQLVVLEPQIKAMPGVLGGTPLVVVTRIIVEEEVVVLPMEVTPRFLKMVVMVVMD
jgi:uncharacterized protein (DUF433 family)